MRHTHRLGAMVSVIAVVMAQADEPFLIELGYLPGGWNSTTARAVSADGFVAAGYSDIGGLGSYQAFRWTEQTGIARIVPYVWASQAYSIDADGSSIAGWQVDMQGEQAFLWIEPDTVIPLGDLPGGDFYSAGGGISGDGKVVVGTSKSQPGDHYNLEAFRWTAETGMVGLGYLPGGRYTYATGVSGDGRVVIGKGPSDTMGWQGYRWTAEDGMVALAPISGPAIPNEAYAVSWDGSVVVGWMSGQFLEASRWTEDEGFVGLGDLPGGEEYSIAYAVNADGSVVGGTSAAVYNDILFNYAFIWDEQHGMRAVHEVLADLGIDTTGLLLAVVYGISADGRTLVITGYNESQEITSWIAYLGNPCPGDFNNDGVVNEQDFTDFLTAFVAGHYSADFKVDATVNSQDFIAFLNAYVAGC